MLYAVVRRGVCIFFFQAEDGIRGSPVTGVQTCVLPIYFGPLRVIAGSHRNPVFIEAESRSKPHPDEKLIYMKAGDVVVTHNGLIHSGTPNTSGQLRYYFGIYYNSSWLKHTNNHSGPLTQRILAEARSRNDYRHMRLVGEEPQLQARSNSGFLVPDKQRWQEWTEADRNAIKSD